MARRAKQPAGKSLKIHLKIQVVDLCHVAAADLEELWQHEVRFWREWLLWDVSAAFAALRRLVERGRLLGKAVLVNAQTVGYAHYGVAGPLGVISGLVVSPDWSRTPVGETLLRNTVDAIRGQGVSRIESPFMSVDYPWLAAVFEREGFRTYGREVLRFDLHHARSPVHVPALVAVEPWRDTHLREAAAILQTAYAGGVEAEIHQGYRTVDGCHVVLDNIVNQGSCGTLVHEASGMAHHRGRGTGFVLVTEVAPQQGHLTHIAVLPEYQGLGIGRGLLEYSVGRVAALGFDTLSLIVSRSNERARGIYQAMGFQSVLAFPVFTWER
jgi:ribosomal protein S18 acetylase RimI-like enzyme